MTTFRKTEISEVGKVMEIIEQAQRYLKELGLEQWQNGYPNREVIKKDIEKGYSYVLLDNEKIIGTAALSFDGEITYDKIYDGQWLTNDDFLVMHRVAVSENVRGTIAATEIMKFAEQIALENNVRSVKIDTHEGNLPMQKYLLKNQFTYCGVIFLLEGSEKGQKRLAYEKVLQEE